ncbi:MAG: hypothetical protein R2867_18485 [Caldilineaceae bacterium]
MTDDGSGDPWIFDDTINLGAGANRLRVRREGGRNDLFVNGYYLATINDNSFAGNNYVGVANWWAYNEGDGAASGFDDFTMHGIGTVYQDDYTDVGSGWAVGDIEICQSVYGGGEYRTISQPNYFCWFTSPSDAQFNGRFRSPCVAMPVAISWPMALSPVLASAQITMVRSLPIASMRCSSYRTPRAMRWQNMWTGWAGWA